MWGRAGGAAGQWRCAAPRLPSCCLHLQHLCSVCRGSWQCPTCRAWGDKDRSPTGQQDTGFSQALPRALCSSRPLFGSHPGLIIIKYVLRELKWPSSGYNLLIGEPVGGQQERATAGQRGAGKGWEGLGASFRDTHLTPRGCSPQTQPCSPCPKAAEGLHSPHAQQGNAACTLGKVFWCLQQKKKLMAAAGCTTQS